MMSTPTQLVQTVPSVVVDVETSPGSGDFIPDDRLRADRVEIHSDEKINEAVLVARLDNDFDAIHARQRYLPDRRLVIRTDEVDLTQSVILFEGYPTQQKSIRDGNSTSKRDLYQIQATGVYSRLAQDDRSWIYGRRMRNGEILDGLTSDPDAYASRSVHVAALPCVFNVDGKGNRAADPITVVDGDGIARQIHIFTFDDDSQAKNWSLLDAVRYLVWFHHLPEGPVSVRELLDATEPAVGIDPHDRGSFMAASMAVERLLVSAEDLNCEATNLVEALVLAAERADLHVSCVAENVGGRCQSRLRLWAAEDGAGKSIGLAWGGKYADGSRRYDVTQLTADDIFDDNQLRHLELRWDHSSLVNVPLIVGDVKQWEMTTELVPGWLPETDLDNVAAPDREQAKLLALTPDIVEFLGPDAELVPWFRKYHKRGSEFDDYRDVSRLWVLNEDDAFSGSSYNRNVPYDDYQPFDFSIVGDETVTSPGRWTRQPRPMQNAITVDTDGSKFGVYVEVSYDSGSTWHPAVGSVTVLKDRAGIWFALSNPTSMTEPDGDFRVVNMWYAIIDQVFRVRATAVFDSDERVGARLRSISAQTPSLWSNARLVYRPKTYRFASRTGTIDALSSVNAGGENIEVDDSGAAESMAKRIMVAQQGGTIETVMTIPWLDDVFGIGDRVSRVRGRDVGLNGPLRIASVRDADWAVVGKTFTLSEGKLQTALQLVRRDSDI